MRCAVDTPEQNTILARTIRASRSAIEHEPAHVIAQPLVVKHEFLDLVGKLRALPPALRSTGFVTLIFRGSRACGPDRVGRCAQLVSRYVSHRRGLSCRVSRFPRCAGQISGSAHGVTGSRAGLGHLNLTPRPGTRQFYRSARPAVSRLRLLEEVQHVLCAIGCPYCKKVMMCVLQGTAATYGNKPGISVLRENHSSLHLLKWCLLPPS